MASKPKKVAAEDIDDEAADAEAASQPKRKLPLNLIVIAAGVLALVGGGGTAGFLMLGHRKEDKPAVAAVKPPTYIEVPEVLVNLSNTGNDRTQYLKVKVVLEIADSLMQPQIQTAMPRVMDAFQTYLRELRATDLDGSAGLYRLKEELTRRVNVAISPNRVSAVLFKEIVVQ